MNSFIIQWKEEKPGEVVISTNKEHSQYHLNRKIAPLNHQPTSKLTESNLTGTVRSNKRLLDDHSYAPLQSIKSANNSATSIRSHHDKRLCSVRSGIATFIIIVILIIIVGICIGIVFGVIKSHNSSGNNNNQNSFPTASTGSLTSSISIGNQVGLPCSGYTEINDPTRNVSHIGSYSTCDTGNIFNTSSGGAWIRFVGSGGTKLTTSSPGVNHCGAFLAGWYNNTLPLATNTITNGTVCFETYASTCGFSVDISVILCSPDNYYVFFLSSLSICNARYCTA